MKSRLDRKARKASVSPGTLVYTGGKPMNKPKISLMHYDDGGLEERILSDISEGFSDLRDSGVTWINIDGLSNLSIFEKLGKELGIHPLTLENILNLQQRPRFEDMDDYLYLVAKMVVIDENKGGLAGEQISFIVGNRFVLTFQEDVGDLFDPIRTRIRSGLGRIRKMGADYLTYSLLDAIVDGYFVVLERLDEWIEHTEDGIIAGSSDKPMVEIQRIKQELLFLRRAVWPLREMLSLLGRGEVSRIHKMVLPYFKDLYDHMIQVADNVDTLRELNNGLIDIHMSSVSNRMNEVMKLLTMIATIFIPLTFIVGIYGMNFKYMPELGWKLGYLGVWGIMAAVALVMLVYFRRKKWL